MDLYDQFAQWAGLFARRFKVESADSPGDPTPESAGIQYLGVTPCAGQLLRAVDAGGVPAFMTNRLKRIAEDNGIDVPNAWTPNDVVAAIRARAMQAAPVDALETPIENPP